jgi:hypothetical protein
LHTYASVEEFAAAATLHKLNISSIPQPIIYIDSDLSPEGERGEILAKDLHDKFGFNNIILATAHNADRFPSAHFPWLRAVRDKTAPW